MENHHHCEICGNMISPSKQICDECERKLAKKRISGKLSPFDIESAIEDWLHKQASKKR